MYDIAVTVSACLRAGTRVDVAWAVEVDGFGSFDRSEALAITPGGGRIGSVLSGSLDDQLVHLCDAGRRGRLVRLEVADFDAELAGLSCGGNARCLLVPAADLPTGLWERLRARDPVCLVTRVDGDEVLDTAMFGPETIADAGGDAAAMFARGTSDTHVAPDTVITVLWPVPKLVIVGSGAIADALTRAADLLGWQTRIVTEVSAATGVIATLAALDKLVVTSHDNDLAGPALAAALAGEVGYIGALGSRRTQESRTDWLAYRGVTDLSRVHGPAGLDIGAGTPPEIAVSIIAEALAARSGAGRGSLRDRSGPIHQDGRAG
jgi:xanthine dehydrogenase accessory factor